MRKIKEIKVVRGSLFSIKSYVATCDDGTAWLYTDSNDDWIQLPKIPAEKKEGIFTRLFRAH